MTGRILIDPDDLRDAARRMRDGRDGVRRGHDDTSRASVPEMPGDLRGRVEATLGRLNLDLTEQRDYMAAEAEESSGARSSPSAPIQVPWNLMLAIDDLFGFDEPPDSRRALHARLRRRRRRPSRRRTRAAGSWAGCTASSTASGSCPASARCQDVINAGIYGLEGDGKNAAWSMGAAVPRFGDAAKGGKIAKEGIKQVVKHGDEAAAAVNAARRVDSAIDGARVVRGDFPKTAGPGEVLVRRHPETGKVTYYQTYDADGLPLKRVDLDPGSRPHGGVPPPHVVEYTRHVNPETGEVFVRKDRHVRAANPDEIPS